MKYHELVTSTGDRFRLPVSHPVLARIAIDAADWFRFEQMIGDTPATRIVGHDDVQDGLLTAYIACANEEIRQRLQDGWG